ncbi:DUF3040 domain-containing protein [Rothia nasimurium]|uniref:DUF3040 domain-containing protein n=1 Tax=Rothia nasimurium TaxID=85336 RepID=UPI003BA38A9F
MALSEQEQALLAQLEKQLNEDPAFSSTMTGAQPALDLAPKASARNLVIGALIAVLGLGVLIAGVSTKLIVVGVLGFLITCGGIYFATLTPKAGAKATAGASSTAKASKAQSGKYSNFMRNLEDKWDERQGGSRP